VNRQPTNANPSQDSKFDVFISHVGEDLENFVIGLADELRRRGLRVWYDDLELHWGDSISNSIARGLDASRFGVLVLSKAFFGQEWTKRELDAFLYRNLSGDKLILPIWHGISREEVARYSPVLGEQVALFAEKGVTAIADSIEAFAQEPAMALQHMDPLRLVIDPGTAPPEFIADILSDISLLYRLSGGSGIKFSFDEILAAREGVV
jgi:hypothetical protein